MYKSPVELYVRDIKQQMTEKLEETCYTAVIEYFPNVDKDELIRALQYDRQQYEQGYRDAKDEIVRCKDCWKWYPYNGGGSHDCLYCGYPEENDYCSDGERKTE